MSFFTSLDSPPQSTKPHVWADYIEVACLESRDKSVGFRVVERVLLSLDLEQEDAELLKDVGVDDLNDNDGRVILGDAGEGWVEEGFRHAKNRENVYGDGYPFLVDDASFEITLKEEVAEVARLYIALLLCANHKYAYSKRKDLTSGFEEICYQALRTLLPSGGEVRLVGTTHAGHVLGITPASNRKIHKFDAMANLLNTRPGYDPEAYSPHDTGESGADLLGWVPFGDEGLPEEIVFADESLLDTLGPAMKALGVVCSFDEGLPEWTEAVEGMASFMEKGGR